MPNSSKTFFAGHFRRANSRYTTFWNKIIWSTESPDRHVEDGTTTTLRMLCCWERASDQIFHWRKDGACRRASWFSWHEDQPLYVDRFPSTEDLSWSHCAIGTVSIQDVLISLIGLLTRWKAACIILYTHTGKNLRFPPDVAIYRLNNLIFNWYFSG